MIFHFRKIRTFTVLGFSGPFQIGPTYFFHIPSISILPRSRVSRHKKKKRNYISRFIKSVSGMRSISISHSNFVQHSCFVCICLFSTPCFRCCHFLYQPDHKQIYNYNIFIRRHACAPHSAAVSFQRLHTSSTSQHSQSEWNMKGTQKNGNGPHQSLWTWNV